MIRFEYKAAFDWYFQNLDNDRYFNGDNKVVVHIVEPCKSGVLETFLHRNVHMDSIRKVCFINNDDVFPSGLYVVLDHKKQSMFFVFPNSKRNQIGQTAVFADHYSFMYDKRDAKTPVHLHMTVYTPSVFDINVGLRSAQDNYFADGVHLPIEGYKCVLFDKLFMFKDAALDICRTPFKGQSGGAARSVARSVTRKVKSPQRRQNGVSLKLARLLAREKIKRVVLIAFQRDDHTWSVTTKIDWKCMAPDRHGVHANFVTQDPSWRAVQAAFTAAVSKGTTA